MLYAHAAALKSLPQAVVTPEHAMAVHACTQALPETDIFGLAVLYRHYDDQRGFGRRACLPTAVVIRISCLPFVSHKQTLSIVTFLYKDDNHRIQPIMDTRVRYVHSKRSKIYYGNLQPPATIAPELASSILTVCYNTNIGARTDSNR